MMGTLCLKREKRRLGSVPTSITGAGCERKMDNALSSSAQNLTFVLCGSWIRHCGFRSVHPPARSVSSTQARSGAYLCHLWTTSRGKGSESHISQNQRPPPGDCPESKPPWL